MSQVSHSRFAVLRSAVVAGFVTVVGLGAAAAPANAASAGGLSVSSVSVGVGSGTVSQIISIASGSPIVGSSGAITISGSDGVFEVTGLTWDASTNGSCRRGSAQSPAWFYTCTASAGGWGAGSFQLAIDTGTSAQQICTDLVCSFGTAAAWSGSGGGTQASGTVTLTNEADLSVSLSTQAPVNSVTLSAANNGPSRVTDAVVTVTGLGNYTVSNVDGQCTQNGSTLTCSQQLGPGQNLFVQPALSGGTGALTLHAVIAGFFQGHSGQVVAEPDTNSANNSFSLTWTPGGSGTGSEGGSGPGGGATTHAAPAPTPSAPASASASTAPASASESASASVSGTDSSSSPFSAPAAAGSSTHGAPLDAAPTGGDNGSGSAELWALLAGLCIVAMGVTSAVLAGKGRHRA